MKAIGFIIDHFPCLGGIRRHSAAFFLNLFPKKESYSQHGEDQFVIEQLRSAGLEVKNLFYIDIGANHPMVISNTYLMYRLGAKGITIEPFGEYNLLHKVYRPKDIQLPCGCGATTAIQKLYVSKTPVLSSLFSENVDRLWKVEYICTYTLDDIVCTLELDTIDFISIDVEGLDYQVLLGAEKALAKTHILCIEANSDKEAAEIKRFLDLRAFGLIKKLGCNYIYKNHNLSGKTKKL